MRLHAGLGGWLSTITVGVAALILQSCVLVAMAAILGVAGFYGRMDQAPPSTALGCAVRCALGGIGALAAALFLGALLATHFGGWWQPSADASMPALLVLLGAVGIWLASAAGAGSVLPQCAFAAITGVLLAWTAWRLALGAAPVMLMSARRRY